MTAPLCTSCGHPRRERTNRPGTYAGAHDWCGACTGRWYRDGRPAAGPPSPLTASERGALGNWERSQGRAWRVGEFARMRDRGYTIAQAARVLGVTYRAGWNYEQELRESEVADAA